MGYGLEHVWLRVLIGPPDTITVPNRENDATRVVCLGGAVYCLVDPISTSRPLDPADRLRLAVVPPPSCGTPCVCKARPIRPVQENLSQNIWVIDAIRRLAGVTSTK